MKVLKMSICITAFVFRFTNNLLKLFPPGLLKTGRQTSEQLSFYHRSFYSFFFFFKFYYTIENKINICVILH